MYWLRMCILLGFIVLITACENSESSASFIDEFEQHSDYLAFLFSDESLTEIVDDLPESHRFWLQQIRQASLFLQSGNQEAAIAILQELASNPNLEITLRLWLWKLLRDFGIASSDTSIYGYILEIPNNTKGVEQIAVYNDGRLYYANTGFSWQLADSQQPLNQAIIHTLHSAQDLFPLGHPLPELSVNQPAAPRLILLSFNGFYWLDLSNLGKTSELQKFGDASAALVNKLFPMAVKSMQEGVQ